MRTRAERIHYRMSKTNRKKVLAVAKRYHWKCVYWEDDDGRVKYRSLSPNKAWLKKQATRKTRRYRRGLSKKGNSYRRIYEIKWYL